MVCRLPCLLVLIAAAGVAYATEPSPLDAQTAADATAPSLTEIVFSRATNDVEALAESKRHYLAYLKSAGLGPEDFHEKEEPVFARYLPVDDENPKRFLAYYIMLRVVGECPPAGCSILIFDTFSNRPEPVLYVSAHAMWIDAQPRKGGLRHIYDKSFYREPNKPFREDTVNQWSWTGTEYEFKGDVVVPKR